MDAQPVAEDQVARKESIDGFVVHRPREGDRDDSKLHRKEVIQPQVPLRLPCYDFIPVTSLALGRCLFAVGARTSGETSFHDVTGGVYKARERIHPCLLIRDY